MNHWWVNDLLQIGGPRMLVGWCVWVIVSITLHELAHGWSAMACGDDTPHHTGHMTWNPVVHMGVPSLVLFALTGMAYGLMPIDPTRMRKTWHEAWVAFAGPLMNLGLAAFAIVVAAVALKVGSTSTGQVHEVCSQLFVFAWIGAVLNTLLAIFNMVPVPPLDGWRIASVLAPPYRRLFAGEGGMLFGLILFGTLFFYGAQFILPLALNVNRHAIDFVAGLMGVPAGP